MEKRKKILISVLAGTIALALFIVFFAGNEENETEKVKKESVIKEIIYPERVDSEIDLNVNAAAAFSLYFDEENEKVLYEKNPDMILPIASITKVMTAIIVLENYNLEEPIGIREEDIFFQSEFRDFRAWEQTKIKEMLYPLLIESNNSAAFSFAAISNRFLENGSDPVENFVKEMNEKGEGIGLEKTEFINPSGLDKDGKANYSTARDVASLAKYALLETDIFDILSKRDYQLHSPSGSIYYSFINTNDFLFTRKNGWEERVVGGKTGWTYRALGCLFLVVESPERDGYLVNVILGADDRFLEMEKLINFAHEAYQF